MSDYKVGQEYSASYDIPPPAKYIPKSEQYKIGQYVDILDENRIKLATFEVKWSNGTKVGGTIINTYGHKRRKN